VRAAGILSIAKRPLTALLCGGSNLSRRVKKKKVAACPGKGGHTGPKRKRAVNGVEAGRTLLVGMEKNVLTGKDPSPSVASSHRIGGEGLNPGKLCS